MFSVCPSIGGYLLVSDVPNRTGVPPRGHGYTPRQARVPSGKDRRIQYTADGMPLAVVVLLECELTCNFNEFYSNCREVDHQININCGTLFER